MTSPRTYKAEPAKYNGWTNRATWLVDIWLTNEESYTEDILIPVLKRADLNTTEKADKLEMLVWDLIDSEVKNSTLSYDLARGALIDVNWQELIRYNKQLIL